MGKKGTKGVQQARQQLPALLEAAHRGSRTIITRHGKPYAAIVPVEEVASRVRGVTVTGLRGSGKKIWKRDAAEEVKRIRGEWR
jgi:prevent-host-death family protein